MLLTLALGACNSEGSEPASTPGSTLVSFQGSACKKEGMSGQALTADEAYAGLQCIRYESLAAGKLRIDLVNFDGGCGAQWKGESETRADGTLELQRAQLERALTAQLLHRGFEPMVRTVAEGHGSFARAVLDAELLLREGLYDLVAVGGVDTAYDPDVVEALLDEGRLFDGEKLDSIIPAEGAAFVLFAGSRCQVPAVGRLLGAAIADEPGHMQNDVPCTALALTRAARAAMLPVRRARERVDLLFTDLTNEHYRIHEFQLAFPRISLSLSPDHAVEVLYTMLGDLGAAYLPTAVALALEGFERGDPAGSTALVLGSSAGPLRGAVCVSA